MALGPNTYIELGEEIMEENVFKINRQIKARALDALTGNFFSILKVMFIPTVLYVLVVMTGNERVSAVAAVLYGLAMLGFMPHASTLMTLQARDSREARKYAKSWSWFALFKVWRNRLKMSADYLAFSIVTTVVIIGSLFGFLVPAVLLGTLLDGFTFIGVIIGSVIIISWLVLVVWVSFKLGLIEFVFSDAIFGDMTTTAFNDVNFSKLSMLQRLSIVIRTSWSLMTWRVFWRYVWLWLTFLGWFLVGLLTFGLAFLFVGPYFLMSTIAFYERVVGEKYGMLSAIEVASVTVNTDAMVDEFESK